MTQDNSTDTSADTTITIIKRPKGTVSQRIRLDVTDVERLAGLGLNAEQVADRLGISRKSLFNVMQRQPEIREAMDRGVSRAVDFAASKLQELIAAGNVAATIFFLKTRKGWIPPKEDTLNITLRQDGLAIPTIDGHVADMVADHSRLLDLGNPDEWEDAEGGDGGGD